jgi:energy-coupling factor transporter ATP-binding protein EcfA2
MAGSVMVIHSESMNLGDGLNLVNVSVTLGHRRRPVVTDVDLALSPGRVVLLTGRSGSGKSTLLKAVSGIVPWVEPGAVDGDILLGAESIIELDPGQRAHLVATCLDRPESQLFLPLVRDEIEAACRRHAPSDAVRDDVVESLGIGDLLPRRVAELSSGERQRVALAMTLMAAGGPLLLDEPTVHLDEAGVADLVGLMDRLVASGTSAVVAEHSGWRWRGLPVTSRRIHGGGLVEIDVPDAPKLARPGHEPGRAPVLEATELVVGRAGLRVAGPLDLMLREGEVVVITGANGAGKSSLARTLCGWLPPLQGRVRHHGSAPRLMLPEAEFQLFAQSVERELGGRGFTDGEVARVLRRHRLEHLAARAPWTLSRGEQQRLVHASWDVGRPGLLVIDEPAQGLDAEDLAVLVDLIHRRAERGRSYLVITHRPEFVGAAHRHLHLEGGQMHEVGP